MNIKHLLHEYFVDRNINLFVLIFFQGYHDHQIPLLACGEGLVPQGGSQKSKSFFYRLLVDLEWLVYFRRAVLGVGFFN
ncbi:MAG: hypothetical protein EA343_17970 [Nodularia sp. (in: Bacteria)]|nr:MAG: hypothetical protein EA343_17970 [Nodularia sp. (in: cyanobacteria)]